MDIDHEMAFSYTISWDVAGAGLAKTLPVVFLLLARTPS